jgi:hypothetical protein
MYTVKEFEDEIRKWGTAMSGGLQHQLGQYYQLYHNDGTLHILQVNVYFKPSNDNWYHNKEVDNICMFRLYDWEIQSEILSATTIEGMIESFMHLNWYRKPLSSDRLLSK